MTSIEFREWPKITRLNRPMIVTEKIDGTNACVIVADAGNLQRPSIGSNVNYGLDSNGPYWTTVGDFMPGRLVETATGVYVVAAQSRKKLISPGKSTDNAGFAGWVREHALELAEGLGEGYHYGEWWGKGIQRGYGLDEKRFSLFNVTRWRDERPACCHVVPTLYEGIFDTDAINTVAAALDSNGSKAAPGWDRPEGVVAYHVPSGMSYKVLCENDELPKGVVGACCRLSGAAA